MFSDLSQRTDYKIVERGDRVCLRPEADSSRGKPAVAMVDESIIVQPAPDAIALRSDAQLVPLTKRGSLDSHASDLVTTSVVVIEIEVVLQCVRSDHVIATIGESEDNAARGVLASGHRPETYRDIDVGVGTAGRNDHVERVVCCTLDQRSATL